MQTDSGETIAVIGNQLLLARHRLTVRQQKVISWMAGQIARDDVSLLDHKLSVAEFAKITGSESGSLYKEMESVTTSLLREVLHLRGPGDRQRVKFQWLSRALYHDGEGTCELRFHEELKPHLLELRRAFTQVRLERFFQFRSKFTIRFFERLEMLRGLNRLEWTLTLAELRDWLGIEEKTYPQFGLLRKGVLDTASRELHEKSDWSFSYEVVKTGRRITGVAFTVRRSGTPRVDPSRERWRRASVEVKAQVLDAARGLQRWDGATDEKILTDDAFWSNLTDLFVKAEIGQAVFNEVIGT